MCHHFPHHAYPLQCNLQICPPVEQMTTVLQEIVNILLLPGMMMLWALTTKTLSNDDLSRPHSLFLAAGLFGEWNSH